MHRERRLSLQKSLLQNDSPCYKTKSKLERLNAAALNPCGLWPGRHHDPTHDQRERGHVVQVRQLAQKRR
jgi:lambda repressor-like predicted transcriptional regulator